MNRSLPSLAALALPGAWRCRCLALPGDIAPDAAAGRPLTRRRPAGRHGAAGAARLRPGHRPRRRRPPGGPLVGGLHAACPAAPGAGEAPPDNGTLRRASRGRTRAIWTATATPTCCCWTPRTPSAGA
ncbi:MAG: hypothetical protein R3F60_19820 [bacterium]